MAEIAAHHEVRPNQVTTWNSQLLQNAAVIFGGNAIAEDGRERIRELRETIGELTFASISRSLRIEYSTCSTRVRTSVSAQRTASFPTEL